ncbi:MAG: condensation domain-containing protein, partial [Acidobacteria bacterium]|nr:condensation domain-containing protein [Acidobacteriota bacterium]
MLDKNNSSMIAAAATHFNKEKEYWLEKLKGNLVKSYFTYDFNESSKIQESMEMIHSRFPEKLFEKFRWISNNSDSKLHMLLVTGVVALLSKYTGNKDIIVGSPIYKQKTEGTFINTVLILRNQLADEMTFKDLLMEVKQTITEAVKNENYPLKALLYELNIPYSEVHFPLFDIVVILKNNQDKKYIQHIQNNITFSFFNNADTIEASIEYNKFLYEEKTVRRIMCHLIQMLECALFNLDLPFKDLYLLSAAEKEELLYHFNNTEKEYPVGLTINQLFEEQVEKTPDKTAVIFGDAKITYGQLNYNADCLA